MDLDRILDPVTYKGSNIIMHLVTRGEFFIPRRTINASYEEQRLRFVILFKFLIDSFRSTKFFHKNTSYFTKKTL